MPITPKFLGLSQRTPVDVLGIGVFDGFHRGHQAIGNHCSTLLTFFPHPALVLGKKYHLNYLSIREELNYFFKHLITLEFSTSISKLSAIDFLNTIILEHLKPRKIVVGYDFKFGYRQKGTVTLLRHWCLQHHIAFELVPALKHHHKIVKSSYIRDLIITDQFDTAIDFLGHDYLIMGTVVKGSGDGKKMGFPTANLSVPTQKLIPPTGVYRGYVLYNNQKLSAGIYIGHKPTFGTHSRTIEVHIINFDGNLYNQSLSVFLFQKIRSEIKFNSISDLVSQIKKDIYS